MHFEFCILHLSLSWPQVLEMPLDIHDYIDLFTVQSATFDKLRIKFNHNDAECRCVKNA